MDDAAWEEMVARHADQLRREWDAAAHLRGAASHTRRSEVGVLLKLAKKAKRALVPVQPSGVFREHLRAGLLLAAHHQSAERALRTPRVPAPNWRTWWVGAAALGAGVAAGSLIARAVRARTTHTHPR